MVKKNISEQAMKLIYELLNGEEPNDVVDANICAIVGEWKFFDDYKKAGQLHYLKD